jgi:hypothetical protein
MFVGHAHRPLLFGARNPVHGEAMAYEIPFNEPFVLNPKDRYIICPGTASYGRMGWDRLSYAIYDQRAESVEIRTVDGPLLAFDA